MKKRLEPNKGLNESMNERRVLSASQNSAGVHIILMTFATIYFGKNTEQIL
jgi:hypothetical protein